MAWKHTRIRNKAELATETYTAPASATQEFSTVIDWINRNHKTATNYATFKFNASAVSGTNFDIALYGSDTAAGTTKYLLLDAVVADITATGDNAAPVDLNAYPAPYYFLAWTADANESANTIAVSVFY